MNGYIFEIENWERKAFACLEHDHQVRYVLESLTSENASHFKDTDVVSIFYSPVDDGHSRVGRFYFKSATQLRHSLFHAGYQTVCGSNSIRRSLVPEA